ncbi:amidohydrolase family protein [Mycolicibacter sinensis]|uniref:Amidohydrolase n=1 Tax=Mycolicibacter sinensis (strain JDM601) TaxID=875328 RepID=A0A1A2Y0N9_MYCSD|nr:amidohydrolase family protein [Mycolicibacter sinensis]OBH14888.1 amidohydrolase [Mycolicibacter sinensis]OBI31579.1 amidohydrolase [Mycolicibacter sinensis]
MLIQRAVLLDGPVVDIRLADTITEVAPRLEARRGEDVLDARNATVIPGLHDHHLHLRSAAAALDSVCLGPPQVRTVDELAAALRSATPDRDGWVRGYGYHESVAGELNAALLDRFSPEVPVRVAHRSGALWVLNSAGLARTAMADHGDGRLLRAHGDPVPRLPHREPSLTQLSRRLAAWGVTGITEATPDHGDADLAVFAAARRTGELLQRLHCLAPAGVVAPPGVTLGPTKIILDDARLDLDALAKALCDNHSRDHGVALHCVTDAQLTVAIAAWQTAGVHRDDRIEHAAVVPDDRLADLAALGIIVITQPNFVAERGDDYLAEIEADRHHELWRLASLRDNGIAVALSTDTPFGDGDPWAAMRAAVHRSTPSGVVLGRTERIAAREALAMFTGRPDRPAALRRIAPGEPGDVCLLAADPAEALAALDADLVAVTVVAGGVVSQRSGSR